MPADLPALEKLTEDVVTAMHSAEAREHRRHASRLRRYPPLLAILMALLVPSGLALHATTASSDTTPSQHHAYDFAKAAGACTAGAVVAVAASRATSTSSCAQPALRR
jgi:hypothetical protein